MSSRLMVLADGAWDYTLTAKTNYIPNIPLTWHQLGPAGHLHSNLFVFIRGLSDGLFCSLKGLMKLYWIKLSSQMLADDEF